MNGADVLGRNYDTAEVQESSITRIYSNEEAVGRGLQRAIDEAIIKKWLDEVL